MIIFYYINYTKNFDRPGIKATKLYVKLIFILLPVSALSAIVHK